ncbi:hypothetical protein BC941DRAFT_336711, partial [Chlamydoabsidia padenii]
MILFVSDSFPCRDYNDGTMFLQMDIERKIHAVDCIALDGGYTQFISQLLHDAPALSDKNFCCPIRKSAGISLTSSEALYNEMFGSFRSSIEAKFGELLACLLLNIKDFVHMLNMPLRPHHSLWEQTGFD